MKLNMADAIINGTLEAARAGSAAPLAVVVLDAGGNMVSARREDGCGIARLDLAYGKAWGSLGMGFGSRTLAGRTAMVASGFLSAANTMLAGRLLPSPGGVIIVDGVTILGAAGVSGDTGDTEETLLLQSLQRLGLVGRV